MLYAATYVVMGLFVWLVLALTVVRTKEGPRRLTYLPDRQGAGGHPLGRFVMVGALSMAGIPPLLGFRGKMGLFRGLTLAGQLRAAGVVAFMAVVSTLYYLRLIKRMYFTRADAEVSWEMRDSGGRLLLSGLRFVIVGGLLGAGEEVAAALDVVLSARPD